MDSSDFKALGAKLFGTRWGKDTKEVIAVSETEKRLLELIEIEYRDSAMPPGLVSNPAKRGIRPSSAAANIQSHPSYRSSLYDDNARPSTAAVPGPGGTGLGGPAALQRPKTQAGGPRSQWAARPPVQPHEVDNGRQRRLTLGAVDGIAESGSSATTKKLGVVPSIGSQLKGKVSQVY